MNNINIIGRLTKDPEIKTSDNGTNIARFSIAVRENKNTTYFFNCAAFKELAERMNSYCKKGSLVGISGRLTQRTWKDNNGAPHEIIEIACSTVEFLTPKKEEEVNTDDKLLPKASITPEEAYSSADDEEDLDLPF